MVIAIRNLEYLWSFADCELRKDFNKKAKLRFFKCAKPTESLSLPTKVTRSCLIKSWWMPLVGFALLRRKKNGDWRNIPQSPQILEWRE